MAIIRLPFEPTSGIPQPVSLQGRRKPRMTSPQFYEQQAQPQQQLQEAAYSSPQQQQSANQGPVQPSTRDFIEQHLQRMSQRPAVPELEPGARVSGPNMELVQPSNFETFYGRLASIREANDALGGAASARAAFQRMQAMQATSGGGPVGSATIGYKNPAMKSNTQYGKAGSGLGLGNVPGIPSNPQANFRFAQNIAGNFGWNNQTELNAWYQLGMKESGWRNTAQNPTSTAYGIGQFLDSTWRGYGIPKTSDPALQVEAMARYIRARYGSPSRALAFHRAHNWY